MKVFEIRVQIANVDQPHLVEQALRTASPLVPLGSVAVTASEDGTTTEVIFKREFDASTLRALCGRMRVESIDCNAAASELLLDALEDSIVMSAAKPVVAQIRSGKAKVIGLEDLLASCKKKAFY